MTARFFTGAGVRVTPGLIITASIAAGLAACGGSTTTQLGSVVSEPAASPTSALRTAITSTGDTAAPAPSFTPAVPPSSACPSSGINVVVWAPDAAMGLRAVTLRAFNCASTSRTLSGFPGIRLLDDRGAILPVAIRKGAIAAGLPHPTPDSVALQSGESAMTVVSWRNITTQGNPITAHRVRIVVAKNAAPQVLDLTVDLGNTGRVAISAWERFRQ